jgi:putative DNA-invertase from lambdoid prophage Rac
MTAAIYARVSTEDQSCALQLTELRGYVERSGWTGVEYVETASGKAGGKRPVLDRLLQDARLKKFDVVLVWKLDRFGRSLQHLIENVQTLDSAGIRFIVPSQNIDTDTKSPMGKFLMHIFGAFAEFERDLIVERVRAGVKEAQRAGKHCGRPARVFRRDEAARLRKAGHSWRQVGKMMQVPWSTVRARLKTVQKVSASPP